MQKKLKLAVIITGFSCNCRCKFCMNMDERKFNKTTQQIAREMILARKHGKTHLSLFGGENSIRPDFIHLVKIAKMVGFKEIATDTNGRMFAYKDFAKKIFDAGLTDIYFSIHGHNAKIHDGLTGIPGAFEQLRQGIENVRSLGFKNFGSHTTIVKQNFRFLPKIADFIIRCGIRSAEFLYVIPALGGAKKFFYELVPKISEAAPYIKTCLDEGIKRNIKEWNISHVPLCLFIGYEDQINQPDTIRTKTGLIKAETTYFTDSRAARYDKTPHVSVTERAHTSKCLSCRLKKICLGPWKEYTRMYGDDELVPIS